MYMNTKKAIGMTTMLLVIFMATTAFAKKQEANTAAHENEALQSQLQNVMASYVEIQELLHSQSIEGLKEKAENLSSVSTDAATAAGDFPELQSVLYAMSRGMNGFYDEDNELFDARKIFVNPSFYAVEIVKVYLKQDSKKPKYKVFYCPVWKYKWVQASMRVANPLHRNIYYSKHHIDRYEKHWWKKHRH